MAVSSDERLPLWQGRIRALALAHRLPASDWQMLSAGAGAKGERLYSWAYQALDASKTAGWSRGLLVRRSLSDPMELAYYHVVAPQNTPLVTLVTVAGTRGCIKRLLARFTTDADWQERRKSNCSIRGTRRRGTRI